MPKTSIFDLPQAVFASILPCISTDDWLTFRLASRGCYEIVHGTNDVTHSFCHLCQSTDDGNSEETAPTVVSEEAENLWNLALVREYRFSPDGNNLRQAIHSPALEQESFLSTRNVFTAPTSFISWKHWRKLEARRGDIRSLSADGSVILGRDSRIKSPGRQVVGPYYLRAAELWKKIEAWLDDESISIVLRSQIRQSLRAGRDMTTLECVEFREKDIVTALVAIYSFYSGQRTGVCGFFGGYCAYNFGCDMNWCLFDGDRPFRARSFHRYFLISDDSSGSLENSVYMDLVSGGLLLVNNQNHPIPAISSDANQNGQVRSGIGDPELEDSLLRWFEEHARRLSSGYYSIGSQFGPDSSPSILHYPSRTETALCSLAVTRGIEVVASSTYNPFERIHIYSIRIRLLEPNNEGYETPDQRGFITAQLHSRHWIITKRTQSHTDTKEEVRGEGVIGEYPLLLEGGFQNYSGRSASVIAGLESNTFERRENSSGTFTYSSCTDADSKLFEGYLVFYPGSLYSPTGDPFQVRVAPFPLSSSPDYYY